MEQLKVCFIGIGSIAKRHISNLISICKDKGISLSIDAVRRSSKRVDGVSRVYTSEVELPTDYDVIFITNPSDKHLETLKTFHEHGKHFFIEKPVVSRDQIERAKQFILKPDSVYYVASPLRYNAVIQWIKANISPADVISVRSISSSYLPEWRPNRDYRDTYSAHKELGGGVSIDLIHEWDYITYLFGWPQSVKSFIGKKSELEINSDDYAIYIAEYDDKIVELHLDYFGRKAIREIQIFTKSNTIVGDLINNSIRFLNSGEEICFDEGRDDYQKRELINFLRLIEANDKECSYSKAISLIAISQGKIEETIK